MCGSRLRQNCSVATAVPVLANISMMQHHQEGSVKRTSVKQCLYHMLYKETPQITRRCQRLGNPKAVNSLLKRQAR